MLDKALDILTQGHIQGHLYVYRNSHSQPERLPNLEERPADRLEVEHLETLPSQILPPEERKKLREQHRKWRTQVIEDDARLFMQAGKSWNNAHILAMDRQYHFLTIAQQQFVEGKADWLAVSEKDLVDASHGRVQLPDDPLAELLLRDAALEEEFVRRRIWYDAADDYYSEARPSFFARSTTSMLAAWLSGQTA